MGTTLPATAQMTTRVGLDGQRPHGMEANGKNGSSQEEVPPPQRPIKTVLLASGACGLFEAALVINGYNAHGKIFMAVFLLHLTFRIQVRSHAVGCA